MLNKIASEKTKMINEQGKECPVCFEQFKPPIYQCYNGHIVCNICLNLKNMITKCPICREPWPKLPLRIRSLAAEELVRNQVYDCPSRNVNCSARLKYEEVDEHKMDCQYMEKSYCQLFGLNCTEKHDRQSILSHLRGSHFDHCRELLKVQKQVVRKNGGGFLVSGIWTFTIDCETSYVNKKIQLNQLLIPLWTEFETHLICIEQKFFREQQLIHYGIRLDGSSKTADAYSFEIKISPDCSAETSVEWSSSKIPTLAVLSKVNNYDFNIPVLTILQFQNLSSTWTGSGMPNFKSLSWTVEIRITKKSLTNPDAVDVESSSSLVATESIEPTATVGANNACSKSAESSDSDSDSCSSIENHNNTAGQGSSKSRKSKSTAETQTEPKLVRNSSWLFSSFIKKNRRNPTT